MNPYMYEISKDLENSINQADVILQNLYDNHLKNRSSVNSHLLFQHVTQEKFTRKKRKAHEIMLFQPKRAKIEATKQIGTALENIIDLYHATGTTKDEKQRIVEILSAHSSYFPKETYKLPEDIRSKLRLLNTSDVISSMINEKMMLTMIEQRNAKGLDPFLSELPDKGKNILETILKKLLDNRPCYAYIESLSHLSNTLETMPLSLQKKIITALVGRLENINSVKDCDDDSLFPTLAGLSPLLSKFSDMRKRTLKKLHKLTLSTIYDSFDASSVVAYCLNQVTGDVRDNVYNNKKIISHCLNVINNSWLRQSSAFNALKELTNLISSCPKTTINEVTKTLFDMLRESNNVTQSIRVIELLGKLGHHINILPNHVIDTFIEVLRHERYGNSEYVLAFSKIASTLEKNPAQFEKVLLDMFNDCIDIKLPFHNGFIIKLLYSWRHYIKSMPDQGKGLLEKLYQHFANNDYSEWMAHYELESLSGCFEHLPNAAIKLMEFFVSQLENSNESIRTYAIRAIGCLQFSLTSLPDSGFNILTKMKEILCKLNNDSASYKEVNAVCFALGHMSKHIAEHPQLIQPIMMGLSALIPYKNFNNDFFKTMHQLYKDFKHVLTFEDKQKIFHHFENNFNMNGYHDFWGIFSIVPNKKNILDKELNSYTPDYASWIRLQIAFNLLDQHSKQLSWLCVIKNNMAQNQVMNNAEHFSLLFLENKRKALLSKKLPIDLVNHIETFVGNTTFKMA